MTCESYTPTRNTRQCSTADKWSCPHRPACDAYRLFQVGISGVGAIVGIYAHSVQEALEKTLKDFPLQQNDIISIYPPNEREKRTSGYHFDATGSPVGWCCGAYRPLPMAELSRAMSMAPWAPDGGHEPITIRVEGRLIRAALGDGNSVVAERVFYPHFLDFYREVLEGKEYELLPA